MSVVKDELGVLVGVDGSTSSREAFAWAMEWASKSGLPVTAVTAYDRSRAPAALQPILTTEVEAGLTKEIEEVSAQFPDVRVTGKVVNGHPVNVLLQEATEGHMLVTGTKGSGGWGGLRLGSVAAELAERCHVPLMVIPDGSTHHPDGPFVVGADGSDWSKAAAEFAVESAAARGKKVELVYARPAPQSLFGLSLHKATDEPSEQERERMDSVAAPLRERWPDVEIEEKFVVGPPGQTLREASKDAAAVFMGSRGHGGFVGMLLGSVSRYLVTTGNVPVVIIRKDA